MPETLYLSEFNAKSFKTYCKPYSSQSLTSSRTQPSSDGQSQGAASAQFDMQSTAVTAPSSRYRRSLRNRPQLMVKAPQRTTAESSQGSSVVIDNPFEDSTAVANASSEESSPTVNPFADAFQAETADDNDTLGTRSSCPLRLRG